MPEVEVRNFLVGLGQAKGLRLQVTVPPNARATVRIPAQDLSQVTENRHLRDRRPELYKDLAAPR